MYKKSRVCVSVSHGGTSVNMFMGRNNNRLLGG